jgi:hydroxyacylglutathione hydrolase
MLQTLKVTPIKAFTDNYIWCIHDERSAVVVDPGDAEPVLDFLTQHNLQLVEVLITHHHYDHTGGIAKLSEEIKNLTVIGPHNPKISGLTEKVKEGDTVTVLSNQVTLSILETPGHTLDHIVFYNEQWLFCGDTLFSAGCGRMFEGTPEVFLSSLDKLAKLPGELSVYCTHEYTLANVKFARHLLPEDQALADYEDWAVTQREQNLITLPSSIEQQRSINPFLLCHDNTFQTKMSNKLQQTLNNAVDTFAAIRAAKDNF